MELSTNHSISDFKKQFTLNLHILKRYLTENQYYKILEELEFIEKINKKEKDHDLFKERSFKIMELILNIFKKKEKILEIEELYKKINNCKTNTELNNISCKLDKDTISLLKSYGDYDPENFIAKFFSEERKFKIGTKKFIKNLESKN